MYLKVSTLFPHSVHESKPKRMNTVVSRAHLANAIRHL